MQGLASYPIGVWAAAADGCEGCGVRYEVQVLEPPQAGCARVQVRCAHQEGCDGEWTPGLWAPGLPGTPLTLELRQEVAGWSVLPPAFIAGQAFTAFGWRAEVAPCSACERLIIGVPLLLMPEPGARAESSWLLAFCQGCRRREPVLQQLLGGSTEDI